MGSTMRPLSDFDHCDSSVPFLLEYYRIHRAWSHADMCEAIAMPHVTPRDLGNYELGLAIPSRAVFDRIVELLHGRGDDSDDSDDPEEEEEEEEAGPVEGGR